MARKLDERNRSITVNKTAHRDFDISEEMECGIVLSGSEVKSLREAKVRLNDAFGRVVRNELWLIGLHIAPYIHGHGFGAHVPDRQRKLLAHRSEILRWQSLAEQQHLTMVPLRMYFKEGRAKVLLGLGRGRKNYDKRQVIAKRDAQREAQRTAREVDRYRSSQAATMRQN
jgi:SsrA-binding protein